MTEKKKELKVKCPVCGKKATWQDNPYRPFCCKRCSMIDLGNWADESYQVAGTESALRPDESEFTY